jgi:DNA modification methylase
VTTLRKHFDERQIVYTTALGAQLAGDSLDLLACLPDESVDAVITSPPFPLLREKEYGNEEQAAYVTWLQQFGAAARRVLRETGSFVIDIGGSYQRRLPVRSLHQFRMLIDWVDNLQYHLAEEFYWHNPSKLPSPIEWVNKRKIRVTDSVNTVWWLSKTAEPKADVRKVLVPYSKSMRRLLKDPDGYYTPKERPSQHSIGTAFAKDNGGAIPKNLLVLPNSNSNDFYLRTCKELGLAGHPARFPAALPRFFMRLLTDPGDVVLDIFSGSNTTGWVAEQEQREWLAFELNREYAVRSCVRFMQDWPAATMSRAVRHVRKGRATDLERVRADPHPARVG